MRPALAALLAVLSGALLLGQAARAQAPFTPFMSPEQEIEVGREEHPKILAQFGGVYDDIELGGYVAVIGASLASNTEMNRYPFTFTVLNSPVVNAFALPGGYVYVTRGLMALANSEAELAGVLAHEIGHVTARHMAQRYSRSVIAGLGAALLGVLTESEELAGLAQVGGALYLSGFSRDQEYEADLLGVRYLARTGYAPRAQADFLRSLELSSALDARRAGGTTGDYDFFATHPRTADRVERAIEAAGKTGGRRDAPGWREPYLARIDGLLYGDDPKEGLVRGQSFVHPVLGITFEAPPDFHLNNTQAAVIAQHPRGAAFKFDAAESTRAVSLQDYVAAWGRELGMLGGRTEPLRVNGMAAATAVGRGRLGTTDVDVRLVAIRADRRQLFRFLFVTPLNQTDSLGYDLRRTTYSFRRLSQAEIAGVRPLRLRIVTARAGDTPRALAARMQGVGHAFERFLVLNRLDENAPLASGQPVKIVAE